MVRRSPNESATEYKVGFSKIGLDDNNYIVEKNKNGIKRWVKRDGVIFIITNFINDSKELEEFWKFTNKIVNKNKWKWIGGSYMHTGREEQFGGDYKYRDIIICQIKTAMLKHNIKNVQFLTSSVQLWKAEKKAKSKSKKKTKKKAKSKSKKKTKKKSKKKSKKKIKSKRKSKQICNKL